jgi:DNA (cytosine-5)-methyltransferase 1
MHWKERRTLTIEELKRGASFPDGFKLSGRFDSQWQRIGNCVPPNLMKAIALHVKRNILHAA